MTTVVKQRIELIRRGEVPAGYKRSKMGVVPVEWEESRLGDFFSERNENNLPDYPLLSITANRGVIPRTEIEGKDNSSDDKSKYKHICIGDIGYNTMRMWQGVSALSSLDGIISPAYTVLVPCGTVSAKYCAYLFKLQTIVNLFYRNSQGLVDDTRSLKYDWFKEIRVALPPLPEQQKIAEILATQDKVIELNDRIIEQLRLMKKALLQKMFPAKGSSIPKVRFPGFTAPWEQRKLGEVIEDYIKKSTSENQYPVLTSSQQRGIVLQDEYFSGERVSQSGNLGYYILPRGYFAYRSRSDNDVFVFNRNDAIDVGIISYFYPVFKPKGVDSNFLLRRLNYGLEEQIIINSEGTGQHVLSLKKFKKMIGAFPSFEEQQRVGQFFNNLDNLITLHQRKRDEEKQKKKALMQLLLTGIVRVDV